MPTVEFKNVFLWGGNMKVDVPETFVDARYEPRVLFSVLPKCVNLALIPRVLHVHQLSLLFSKPSDFRQIPDHQEVYVDNTGRDSIVIEVVERVKDADDDLEALRLHLKDIVDTQDRMNIWYEKQITMPKFPYVEPLL